MAFASLKKDHSQPMGASKAYHESQSRIYKLEAPLYVGVGEGTDNMDFLALKKCPERSLMLLAQFREAVQCCCES